MREFLKPIGSLILYSIGAIGLLSFTEISSQTISFSIPFAGQYFTTDNIGNIYTVDSDYSIRKYSDQGKLIARVNFKIYGDLAHIDASNPFEVYLHYRDQQRLVIIDNLLSIRGEIDLSSISNVEISALCRSYDNGFWCFDGGTAKLIKYSKDRIRQKESISAAIWTSEVWKPHRIYEDGKNVYVLDSTNGIAIFDVFAQFKKIVRLKGVSDIQIVNDEIIYRKADCLIRYNPILLESDTLICDKMAIDMKWNKDHFIKRKKGKLEIL